MTRLLVKIAALSSGCATVTVTVLWPGHYDGIELAVSLPHQTHQRTSDRLVALGLLRAAAVDLRPARALGTAMQFAAMAPDGRPSPAWQPRAARVGTAALADVG